MPQSEFKPFSPAAIIAIILLLCLSLFCMWAIYKATFPPSPPLQGQIEARTINIASRGQGRVGRILVQEGDLVSEGQLVAELALPELEAKLAQARDQESAAKEEQSLAAAGPREREKEALKAEWERKLALAELAAKTRERLQALYSESMISSERRDQAIAAATASAAAAQAARDRYDMALAGSRPQAKAEAAQGSSAATAKVAEVEALAANRALYTPVSGQVCRVMLEEGEVIEPGAPALTVVDLEDQWASFNIVERDMPGIRIGSQFSADIPALGARNVIFRIYYINPYPAYATWRSDRMFRGYGMRTFEARAKPINALSGLRPGMNVLVASGRLAQ